MAVSRLCREFARILGAQPSVINGVLQPVPVLTLKQGFWEGSRNRF
ncbi:hypothetical protein DNHGIG_19630 [Collibacillus ludicampi]|uniref:Uncharacterized protein n=1 Tax=Collibacillus ludicampi TaxID=2771369 RepID=A0AAV4LFH3_9BACL|nr:hypothetical protein [Collibacillus ludicampi]GIM46414.1 hypothetical protein DNHGIG_19630 [Collibacillus ludicampi]